VSSGWATVLQYGVPAIGVVIAAVISGLFVHHANRHTRVERENSIEAAKKAAEAALIGAYAKASETQDRHWARFCDANDHMIDELRKQVTSNAKRIADAELAIIAAEERARNWETLYRKAAIYLRKLFIWLDDRLPGESYPMPPADLDLDL